MENRKTVTDLPKVQIPTPFYIARPDNLENAGILLNQGLAFGVYPHYILSELFTEKRNLWAEIFAPCLLAEGNGLCVWTVSRESITFHCFVIR